MRYSPINFNHMRCGKQAIADLRNDRGGRRKEISFFMGSVYKVTKRKGLGLMKTVGIAFL